MSQSIANDQCPRPKAQFPLELPHRFFRRGLWPSGGDRECVVLFTVELPQASSQLDLLAMHETLDELAAQHPRIAELVKMRFFLGMTRQEAADVLGISTTTADDDWAYAKGWLRVRLGKEEIENG